MIGGNINGILQLKSASKNAIGEAVTSYTDAVTLLGWLDLPGGGASHANYSMAYSAKIQESTHIFICDYKDLRVYNLNSENCRMIVNGLVYEVLMIDNPMELNKQLEIYLKYVGGQNGE